MLQYLLNLSHQLDTILRCHISRLYGSSDRQKTRCNNSDSDSIYLKEDTQAVSIKTYTWYVSIIREKKKSSMSTRSVNKRKCKILFQFFLSTQAYSADLTSFYQKVMGAYTQSCSLNLQFFTLCSPLLNLVCNANMQSLYCTSSSCKFNEFTMGTYFGFSPYFIQPVFLIDLAFYCLLQTTFCSVQCTSFENKIFTTYYP